MRRGYSVLLLVLGLWSVPQGAYAQFCPFPFTCNDNNGCTIDTCLSPGICSNVPKDCNDGNPCTLDSCIPFGTIGGICIHQGLDCDDQNACTADSCDAALGCLNDVISCDDGDACTANSCDAALGCLNDVISCDDGDACTVDSCDPVNGCVHDAIVCDDGNACTVDSCFGGVCGHEELECEEAEECMVGSCDPATGCVLTPRNCDDGDACTADSCDPTTGGCVNDPIGCDDGDACTADSCDPASGCVHDAVLCHSGDKCKIDSCDPTTGCVYEASDCDDGNACTADSCDPATGCAATPIDCDDGDECTADSCDTKSGCAHEKLDCIDAIACSSNEFICKSVDYHDADGDGIIEVGEPTKFDVTIEVANPTGGTWSGVVVSDRFGGEIGASIKVVPGVNPTQGTVKITAKGATQKQTLTWTIGSLPAGGSAILVISARTDLNPGGHQQYTSCGTHAFNSGAVLKYYDSKRVKYSANTGVVELTVLTADLAGDCDGDGASDGEELDAGTDPLDPTSIPPTPGACSDGSQPVENCIGSGDVPIPCCSVPNGTTCPNGQPNYECFLNGQNIFCCSPD